MGVGGGCLPEVLKFYQMREHGEKPKWVRTWFYWIMTAIMVILGGGVVAIYMAQGATQMNPILALHLGAATPVLIQGVIAGKPNVETN